MAVRERPEDKGSVRIGRSLNAANYRTLKAAAATRRQKKRKEKRKRKLTTPIDIILRLGDILPVHDAPNARLLAHIPIAFAQDHNLVPRDLVLLDRFPDDLLAHAVAVHVRRVPGVEAAVVRRFKKWEGLLFVDDPGLPLGGSEAHGAEDGVGDAQAAGAEAMVGCFCGGDGAQDGVLLG
jgi:hypothetical protein